MAPGEDDKKVETSEPATEVPAGTPSAPDDLEKKEQANLKKLMDELRGIVVDAKKRIGSKFDGMLGTSLRETFRWNAENMKAKLKGLLDVTFTKFNAEAERILASSMNAGNKLKRLGDLREQLRQEVDTSSSNIVALLNQMSEGELGITREVLAKIELYAPVLEQILRSPKGEFLSKIFSELLIVNTIKGKVDGKTYQEVLTEAILDNDLAPLAFTILTIAHESVRDEFTKEFIKTHPDKALWIIEKGSTYGCYSAAAVYNYFEYTKTEFAASNSDVSAKAARELENFPKYEQAYQIRYDVAGKVKKRAMELDAIDANNPALKMLNARGIGRGIGYVASVLTLIGNFVANRELIMKNPGMYLKMPYVIGATGMLGYLTVTGKERGPGEILTSKTEKDEKKRVRDLQRLTDILNRSATWGRFLSDGGVTMLQEYWKIVSARNIDIPVTFDDFMQFLTEIEKGKKIPEEQRPSRHLKGLIASEDTKKRATSDLMEYMRLIKELNITDQTQYTEVLKETKQKSI